LWFGPGAILLLGAGALARFYANRRRQESAGGDEAAKPLSETEKKRLQSLLKNGDNP
jgi:cytochrome c-type biogenesis protein CcmH/NrfF